jgi:DNA modification methylase
LETEAVSKVGEIYELGNSLLICGDSTKPETFQRLMGAEKADIVFTSPPYNSGTGNIIDKSFHTIKALYHNIADDKLPKEQYYTFLTDVMKNLNNYVGKKHSVFWNMSYNANSRDDYGKIVFSKDNPFSVKETIVWYKHSVAPVGGVIVRRCELIFLMSNYDGYLVNPFKEVRYNYWDIDNQNCQQKEHFACFPVALPEKAIVEYTAQADIVLEPFCGSGTTLIAAEKNGRKCRGIELSPLYCDLTRRRWTKWARDNGREVGSGGLEPLDKEPKEAKSEV